MFAMCAPDNAVSSLAMAGTRSTAHYVLFWSQLLLKPEFLILTTGHQTDCLWFRGFSAPDCWIVLHPCQCPTSAALPPISPITLLTPDAGGGKMWRLAAVPILTSPPASLPHSTMHLGQTGTLYCTGRYHVKNFLSIGKLHFCTSYHLVRNILYSTVVVIFPEIKKSPSHFCSDSRVALG